MGLHLRPSSTIFVGLALFAGIAGIAGLACTGDEQPAPKTYEPDEVIAAAIEYATQLERLDLEPVPSIHLDMEGFGEFYANEAAATVFRTIDGPMATATVEFPQGALLVKNNLDANGDPRGALSILAKFEAGYNPQSNDWFFAVVTFEGEVINDIVGKGVKVYACYDCHSQRGPNTDLVIGLEPEQLR